MTDKEFLQFVHDRLEFVYHENHNTDFMIKFREIIKKCVEPVNISQIIRSLNVGQSTDFELQHWGTVRSTASNLKKMFGVAYTVHKEQVAGENRINITRIR